MREFAEEFGFTLHVRPRGQEAQELKKSVLNKARRRVVKRTPSWLNRFRAILIRWEKKAESYLAMLHFALGIITWRNTDLRG